jgi:hypothetical protein
VKHSCNPAEDEEEDEWVTALESTSGPDQSHGSGAGRRGSLSLLHMRVVRRHQGPQTLPSICDRRRIRQVFLSGTLLQRVRMEPGGHCPTSWRSTPSLPGGHGQRSTMYGQTRPRQIQDQMTHVLSIKRRQESHTCMYSLQSLWVLQ